MLLQVTQGILCPRHIKEYPIMHFLGFPNSHAYSINGLIFTVFNAGNSSINCTRRTLLTSPPGKLKDFSRYRRQQFRKQHNKISFSRVIMSVEHIHNLFIPTRIDNKISSISTRNMELDEQVPLSENLNQKDNTKLDIYLLGELKYCSSLYFIFQRSFCHQTDKPEMVHRWPPL